jgi:DNA primase
VSGKNNDGRTLVLQAANIVELIGQTVKLTRRGTRYVGLCPFHQEKTPSFSVNPDRQYFYCFGCKANGNAIDFVMKRDRLGFLEALQQLAQQYGVELPKYSSTSKQNLSERQALLEANSAACMLFEKMLSHPQIGAAAREYLAKRGFTEETIKRFRIGYAMESWDALLKSQAMKKFSPQMLHSAGLLKARDPEKGEGFYDTFRNRIMFPIRDDQGRIIAFGGRIMPGSPDPAKYLNSPETPLFSKSRNLYGLDLAKQKIVESKTVAIVEGYTDVVMSHQYGATNVVSPLGTALTEQHVGILKRFADRIVLLFDPDEAGDLAVDRAVQLLLSQEVEIAVASMPQGVDPDEFLLNYGLSAFEDLLLNAQDVLSYKWRQLLREYNAKDDLTGQQKAVEQYLELLASARGSAMVDPLRWGAILARVSRLTDIPAEQLNRRFRRPKKAVSKPVVPSDAPAPTAPDGAADVPDAPPMPARPANADDRAESWVLGALLAEPSRWSAVQQSIGPKDFTDPQRQKLAQTYWDYQRDEGEPSFSELLAALDDEQSKDLAVTLLDEIESLSNIDQALNDAIGFMQQRARKLEEHKKLSAVDDEVEKLRLIQERARKPDIRRGAS